MKAAPILFCGDPHSQFRQIVAAVHGGGAQSVILLGDMEPERSLELEMAPLDRAGVEWYFVAGNHDADSQAVASRVWNQRTDPHNVHGRVVTLKGGLRLAGLAGVFRGDVWYPKAGGKNGGRSTHYSREDLARVTPQQYRFNPRGDLAPQLHHKQWASIFEAEYDALAEMQADILVTHEAPSYHSTFTLKDTGFQVIDELAQFLGARYVVHGHHHDNQDSSVYWTAQRFESHAVGLRGVSALWPDGRWEVIVPGDIDDARRRQPSAPE
jgi:DNA repair exonuclease SbcCD nuclease subunit